MADYKEDRPDAKSEMDKLVDRFAGSIGLHTELAASLVNPLNPADPGFNGIRAFIDDYRRSARDATAVPALEPDYKRAVALSFERNIRPLLNNGGNAKPAAALFANNFLAGALKGDEARQKALREEFLGGFAPNEPKDAAWIAKALAGMTIGALAFLPYYAPRAIKQWSLGKEAKARMLAMNEFDESVKKLNASNNKFGRRLRSLHQMEMKLSLIPAEEQESYGKMLKEWRSQADKELLAVKEAAERVERARLTVVDLGGEETLASTGLWQNKVLQKLPKNMDVNAKMAAKLGLNPELADQVWGPLSLQVERTSRSVMIESALRDVEFVRSTIEGKAKTGAAIGEVEFNNLQQTVKRAQRMTEGLTESAYSSPLTWSDREINKMHRIGQNVDWLSAGPAVLGSKGADKSVESLMNDFSVRMLDKDKKLDPKALREIEEKATKAIKDALKKLFAKFSGASDAAPSVA